MHGIIIVLLVHIIVCVAVKLAKCRESTLKLENLMPIVFAVPFFGMLCFLLCLAEEKYKMSGRRAIGLEQEDVMKGRYMQIKVEEDADVQLVPLEEAILVNEEKIRRSIMLHILHGHPEEDIEILQRASCSDDMEITHYATTIMMELMTEREKKIQEYDRRYRENPEPELIYEYIDYLYGLIRSKLADDHMEQIYRQRIAGLIEQYEKKSGHIGELIFVSIENDLMLGENEKALEQLRTACMAYPGDERVYRLYGHYFANLRDSHSFQEMISGIKDDNVYLSREGREWLAFWSGQTD